MSPFLSLHPDDNIVVARTVVPAGTPIPECDVATREEIPFGHKVATRAISPGALVRKYGQVIGFATGEIQPGDWVHSQNLGEAEVGGLELDYAFASEVPEPPAPIADRTFLGYRRSDGRAATRNYIGLISTVNCSATTSKLVARHINEGILADYPTVDGVVALTHQNGCSWSYGGDTHRWLARVLGGFARHPNFGAYIIIGLGCEASQPGFLVNQYDLVQLEVPGRNTDEQPPLTISIQDEGGVRKTVERVTAVLKDMLPVVNQVKREPIPVSELILATECGGSDGNSGITANPAVGVASDLLVAAGGTSILGEVPEIYGAEHLLTRRAVSRDVGQKLIDRIRWWEEHTGKFDCRIDNNPSVGNKAGGLTTIYEKSLGAVAKGGSTALRAVYEYAEPVTERGFVVMDTPGFDPHSVTGMVAGGANVVVFTTGRGSCFGCKPVPSIKIATNSPMFHRMEEDMDINAGTILEGESVETVGREIFESIIRVAGGEPTKSEAQNIGDEEFCPWVPFPIT